MTHSTPRRLFPLALGSVLLGSAGCAALALGSGAPDELDPEKLALEQEVARLNAKLGESGTLLKRSKRRVGDLERRLADFGVRLASRDERRREEATAERGSGPETTTESPVSPAAEPLDVRAAVAGAGSNVTELAQSALVAGRYTVSLSGGLNGANGAQNGNWSYVANFANSIADQRFTRAQEALELESYQVAELRRIVAERDVAYSNAAFARVEDDGSGARVVRDVDAYALQRADEVFGASIEGLLGEKQRKVWKAGNWQKRFEGRRPHPRAQSAAVLGFQTIRLATFDTEHANGTVRLKTVRNPQSAAE